MPQRLILASGSSIRSQLLQQACVPHEVSVAQIDEQMIKMALLSEQAPPRDIADTLAEMKARKVSDYIHDYVARNWDSISHAVGAYKLEEEGVRLFSGIEGDYFNVLGLPLLELLNYLTLRGDLSA